VVPWHFAGFCHGDADGDDYISNVDFVFFRDAYLKTYASHYTGSWGTGVTGTYSPQGDFDMDGLITNADFIKFRDYYLGTPPHDCTPGTWPPGS
jgi:hypothetical protein